MNLAYLVLGASLLVLVVLDLLWTTLWVEGGAGPLTSRLTSWTWRSLKAVAGRRPRALSLTGPLVLVTSLTVWIALLWLGWTLLFAGGEQAIVDARDAGPISWTERAYFVGYSVFTLGNGDFTPSDGVWQIATSLATASGMLFVTLSVTYVLSVLGAVTQKRAFASTVSGLGSRGTDILRTSWDGDAFRGLGTPLNAVATQLNTLTSNHKAYPVLHYFYSARADRAPPKSIAVLDDALTLLRFGVPERNRPSDIAVAEARASVRNYLSTLDKTFVDPADRTPPAPELSELRDADIPTVSDREFARSVADLEQRRRTLLGLVESDAREWPQSGTGGEHRNEP